MGRCDTVATFLIFLPPLFICMIKLTDLLKEVQWTSTNTMQPLASEKPKLPIGKVGKASRIKSTPDWDVPKRPKKGEELDSEFQTVGEWSPFIIDIDNGKAYVYKYDYELGNQNVAPGDKISFTINDKTYKAIVQDEMKYNDKYLLKIIR